MLKREFRLPARLKFTRFSAYRSQSFKLTVSENGLAFSRFGFVIGKRVDKRAVVRNRSKRLLRSCIEELLSRINGSYDMLFIIHKKLTDASHDDIMDEVLTALKKTKAIN